MKSGNSYTLSDLFSEDRKIIIPDLQRDYCWGNGNKQHDLVLSFIDNLIEADWGNELMLGLIYGYEHPKNHIQLCDGQQRLTTLFLLLGMLNKYCKGNPFSDKLISKFELDDDKEPYLLYSIRESTLYFLSDLVTEFFLKEGDSVKDITQKDWYFKDYAHDPSIVSMIEALKTIETKLGGDKLKDVSNKKSLGDFILNNLKFLYYDMQNRQNGEETFVIINTTGEPLTATENLKPILLSDFDNHKFSEEWEERETYFWKNKKENEVEADNGVNDFLNWYVKIISQNDTFELANFFKKQTKEKNKKALIEIQKYFNKLPILIKALQNNVFASIKKKGVDKINSIQDLRSFNINDDIEEDIILPLLAFIAKFEDELDIYQFLRRLRKNYCLSLSENLNWRYILQIIEKSESLKEVLEFNTNNLIATNIPIGIWYNDEEKVKTELKKEHKKEIEEMEDHKDFMGDLSPLLALSDNKNFTELECNYNHYTFLINPQDSEISNLFEILKRIDDIKNKRWGHGKRGKDFHQHLYYCHKSTKKLHLETWFEHFFKAIPLQDKNAYFNKLKNVLKTLVSSSVIVFIENDVNDTEFEKEESIFYLLGKECDNIAIDFNWIYDLHKLENNNWHKCYNRKLFIVILIFYFYEEMKNLNIGVAFRENPYDKTREFDINKLKFDNIIGHYDKAAGNSNIHPMGYFKNGVSEKQLIEDLNSKFSEF